VYLGRPEKQGKYPKYGDRKSRAIGRTTRRPAGRSDAVPPPAGRTAPVDAAPAERPKKS
jgi:hypothetical protein